MICEDCILCWRRWKVDNIVLLWGVGRFYDVEPNVVDCCVLQYCSMVMALLFGGGSADGCCAAAAEIGTTDY